MIADHPSIHPYIHPSHSYSINQIIGWGEDETAAFWLVQNQWGEVRACVRACIAWMNGCILPSTIRNDPSST